MMAASNCSMKLNIVPVLKTVLAKAKKMKNDAVLMYMEYMNSFTVLATKNRYAKSEVIDRADFRKQLQCC